MAPSQRIQQSATECPLENEYPSYMNDVAICETTRYLFHWNRENECPKCNGCDPTIVEAMQPIQTELVYNPSVQG